MSKKLLATDVFKNCNPDIFNAETTETISSYTATTGQERVLESLKLAVGIKKSNYNVFALGQSGIGKKNLITKFLKTISKDIEKPKEYCYVHNFINNEKPIYLEFNQGEVCNFKQQVDSLIEELESSIPAILESEAYQNKVEQVVQKYIKKQEEALNKIKLDATSKNINIVKAQQGFALVSVDKETKKPLEKDQINALSPDERKTIEDNIKSIQAELEDLIGDMPALEREKQEKLKKLKYQTIKKITEPKINQIIQNWSGNLKAVKYLKDVKEEILSNSNYFYEEDKNPNPLSGLLAINKPKTNRGVFKVNAIVERKNSLGNAPIIVLNDPSYSQLFGKIEHVAQFGFYSTDLTLIKSGALHMANGGYLIVNARPLLENPVLWYQLKKVIKTGSIYIAFDNSFGSSVLTLEPEPIPFNGKIILLGEHNIYNALWYLDPEFKELFKITAEFNTEIKYDKEGILLYSEFASSVIKEEELKHMDKFALARLVEIGARQVESQNHLTTNMSILVDIIREANYMSKNKNISVKDIDMAYEFRKQRLSRIPNFIKDQIKNKIILIETEGKEVGQINGLSVISINDFMFGQPQRISCSVFQGQKDIIDVERSVNLAGAIYSKAVMIISAFLHNRFSQENLLNFSSTINFEQSYGKIDGDSATAATTLALMSALSDIPINQSFAVTGSMDQKGRIQAIGGVNEKIEGFFAICKARGLNGKHSVLIPISNIKDLMLSKEIQNAIKNHLFNIYAIEHIDEGIELLTGISAGIKNKNGKYPINSINGLIQKRWVKKSSKN